MSDARKEAERKLRREAAIHYRHQKVHQGGHNSVKFVQALQNFYGCGGQVSEAETIIENVRKEEE